MSTATLLRGQVQYANREFWRTPVSAFFTLVFPLSFLVILSTIYGNEVLDPSTGLRLAQYTTPVFAVFSACMACYMSLGTALAYARQSGVLKRLRGTPLPSWVHLAGRVLSAVALAAIGVLVMVAVGVLAYDVQIVRAHVPALVLTFVVGTACFTALGLAVAALARTPNAASAFTNASLILLAFISGVFAIGDLPDPMQRVAGVFPLKPFVESFAAGFNPAVDASAPDWGNLAIMAAWGLAGILVTRRALSWEPTGGVVLRHRQADRPDEPEPSPATSGLGELGEVVPTSPSSAGLVGGQARYALQQMNRDAMSVFFAVAFPVLLVVFFASVSGPDAQWGGVPLAQYLAPAFTVYGVAVAAFVNLAGGIAEQRTLGVLKRLRGTPLPPAAYLAGRVLGSFAVGAATTVLVFGVGALFFDVALPPARWPATALAVCLAILCFCVCGLALVSVVDAPQAVIAATLCILLPLSFVSDIFIAVEEMPAVLDAVGWTFPLRHAVAAAVAASSGAALDSTFWLHLLVLVGWTAAAALIAARWFHWEPRRGGA
jgi:ABC-type multidrug transport system permease subunit